VFAWGANIRNIAPLGIATNERIEWIYDLNVAESLARVRAVHAKLARILEHRALL